MAQGAARRQCGHAAHVHGLRCLQLDEGDLRSQALHVRRKRLEYVLDRAPAVLLPVRRLSDHGLKAWQQVVEHAYEGLVAKDPASPYVGGRTLKWLKVKQRDYRVAARLGAEFVAGRLEFNRAHGEASV